ncbi:MAG: hypothetical protein JWP29_3277 [Rhodoferax sp.]|nr:hypothetical protein [Rhodoferax sp.]
MLSSGQRRHGHGHACAWARGLWLVAASGLIGSLLACAPPDQTAQFAAARAALARHEPEQATGPLQTILLQDPRSAPARSLLGKALYDLGNPAGAEVEFRRALELGYPADGTVPALAAALLGSGQSAKLRAEFGETTLPDAQADAELKSHLAMVQALSGDVPAALASLHGVLQRTPASEPALLLLARLTAVQGDVPGALAQVQALIDRRDDFGQAWQLKTELQAALAADARVDVAQALAAGRRAHALMPHDYIAPAALVRMYLDRGDSAMAQQQWQTLHAIAPGNFATIQLQARLAWLHRDYALAARQSLWLLNSAPDDRELLMLAGRSEMKLHQADQAETHFRQASRQPSGQSGALCALASVQLRRGAPDAALATLSKLLRSTSPGTDALTLAVYAHLLRGDTRSAQADLARALHLDARDLRVRTAAALSLWVQGREALALAELQPIAAQAPGAMAAQASIAALTQRHDWTAAGKLVDALALNQPDSPLADLWRGRIAVQRADLPGAQAHFEAVLRRDPLNAQALVALADIGARQGAPSTLVVERLSRAISAEPASVLPRLRLIDHLRSNGRPAQALEAAQAASTDIPDQPDLLRRLGEMLASAGQPVQSARAMARLASLGRTSDQPVVLLEALQALEP